MNDPAQFLPNWPREVVRVTGTPSGIRLYFPPLRVWRFALRLGLTGIALLVPALIASIAFAPTGKYDAAALLTLVLTAAFVYPLLLFGAAFVLVALFAVSTSLTVDAGAHGMRAVRRVCGIKVRDRKLPRAAIAVLEQETATAPRGLGGASFYQLIALTRPSWNASDDGRRYNVRRMVVADGMPDEALAQALEALLSGHLRLGAVTPLNAPSSEN